MISVFQQVISGDCLASTGVITEKKTFFLEGGEGWLDLLCVEIWQADYNIPLSRQVGAMS